MSDDYQPSEDQIQKLIETKTPRELAIGYLRAQRRASQARMAFDVLDGLSMATDAVRDGDGLSSIEALRDVEHRLHGR